MTKFIWTKDQKWKNWEKGENFSKDCEKKKKSRFGAFATRAKKQFSEVWTLWLFVLTQIRAWKAD